MILRNIINMIKYHNILLTEKKKLLDSQIGSMIFRKMIYNMYNNVNHDHLQGNFHIFQLSFLNILIQKCLIRGKVNIYTYIYIFTYIYILFFSLPRGTSVLWRKEFSSKELWRNIIEQNKCFKNSISVNLLLSKRQMTQYE